MTLPPWDRLRRTRAARADASTATHPVLPQGLSIACSTPEALKWDPEWENMHEIRWVGGWRWG